MSAVCARHRADCTCRFCRAGLDAREEMLRFANQPPETGAAAVLRGAMLAEAARIDGGRRC